MLKPWKPMAQAIAGKKGAGSHTFGTALATAKTKRVLRLKKNQFSLTKWGKKKDCYLREYKQEG